MPISWINCSLTDSNKQSRLTLPAGHRVDCIYHAGSPATPRLDQFTYGTAYAQCQLLSFFLSSAIIFLASGARFATAVSDFRFSQDSIDEYCVDDHYTDDYFADKSS